MVDSSERGPSTPPASTLTPGEPRLTGTHYGLSEFDPWPHQPSAARSAPRLPLPFGLEPVAETLEVLALALLMFLAVRFVAQNFIVDGQSMEPNFTHGDLLVVNKLAYRSFNISWLPWSDNDDWRPFGEPRAGDVVVFHFPQSPDRDFIKRVVAVPGQTVEVRDGVVFVDGAAVAEPFVDDPARYRFGPEVVPADQLFVLGDNRNNSFDSHSWGMLARDLVVGRAELRYWPLGEAGLVDRYRAEGVPAVGLSEVPRSP